METISGTVTKSIVISATAATKQGTVTSTYLDGWCVLPVFTDIANGISIEEGTEDNTVMVYCYQDLKPYYVGATTKSFISIAYPDTRCFDTGYKGEVYNPTTVESDSYYEWDNLPYENNISMQDYGVNYFVPPMWHGIILDSTYFMPSVIQTAEIPLCQLNPYATITDTHVDSTTAQERYDNIIKASSENFGKEIKYPLESTISVSLQQTIIQQNVETATITFYCSNEDESTLPTRVHVCVCDSRTGNYEFITDTPSEITWSSGTGTCTVPQGINTNTLRTTIMDSIKDFDGQYFIGFMFPEWYPVTYDDIEG